MTKQEKRKLLHEGLSQRSQQSADANLGDRPQVDHHTYIVEVTLDNSARQIPFEADDLVVRKTYNTKSDREDVYVKSRLMKE